MHATPEVLSSHLLAGADSPCSPFAAPRGLARRRLLLGGVLRFSLAPAFGVLAPHVRAAAASSTEASEQSRMPWRPMLAQEASADIDPSAYLVSEKLDGVRALWDGQRLWFRSGLPIKAPPIFLAQLPPLGLDGELWLARGQFEALVGTVRRAEPDAQAWSGVRFMAFDMPQAPGSFAERAATLYSLGQRHSRPAWAVVPQRTVATRSALQSWLSQVVTGGGEGLMLHRADAPWRGGRSDVLLKLKPQADAEAQVVGYEAGRGRHAGRLGALRVRTGDGVEFKLGTGFSDAQREQPPALGSWVTYTYRGLTEAGVPRFAAFHRVRPGV
jgi:DNA ligase 1